MTLKVYLQYPWKFPDSPYYKYLVENPPKDIQYLNAKKQKGVITKSKKFAFSNKFKRIIRKTAIRIFPSKLNIHKSPEKDYDLIHCAHCLSSNSNEPWIADLEASWQFWVSAKKTKRGLRKVERILKRDNCKKILPWTKEIEDEILKMFPFMKEKSEVVYPAIPEREIHKKKNKEIILIFSGRYFFWKGGLHALEAIDRLTKEYKNVKGIFNSEVPEEIKKKYSENKKIEFYELLPQKELFKLYEQSDILVYPGYTDSFGFAFLEAMSFGLPIVTFDGDSRKEIIDDGRTGFILEKPGKFSWDKIGETEKGMVDNLIEKTSKLIENRSLREKISKACLKEISEGKFSIKERNKKLKRIYEEALK